MYLISLRVTSTTLNVHHLHLPALCIYKLLIFVVIFLIIFYHLLMIFVVIFLGILVAILFTIIFVSKLSSSKTDKLNCQAAPFSSYCSNSARAACHAFFRPAALTILFHVGSPSFKPVEAASAKSRKAQVH